jgi:hypothetical protein
MKILKFIFLLVWFCILIVVCIPFIILGVVINILFLNWPQKTEEFYY